MDDGTIHPQVRIGHVHPRGLWPRTPDGDLAMFTRRLDLAGLLREAEAHQPVFADAPGTGPRDLG